MDDKKINALKFAFLRTIPVLVGYLFLGIAYGILMQVNGFGLGWVFASSLFIYAGSLQYIEITLLVSMVHPLYAFLMGLMINARHLFYGISMLKRYGEVKKFKPYLIFAMTDETFSVLCHEEVPRHLDKDWVYFWTSLLDQSYWVTASFIGYFLGGLITFDTKGLDFALTALFVVIFIEQWKENSDHSSAMIGVAASVVCLIIWGASSFIIPSMILILGILTWKYKKEQEELK